jgi:hypothetical protein
MLDLTCAAVLAKRWESAAQYSTDSVAGVRNCFNQIGLASPCPQLGALTANPWGAPLPHLDRSLVISVF